MSRISKVAPHIDTKGFLKVEQLTTYIHNFTILVRVVKKHPIRLVGQDKKKKVMNVVLADESGEIGGIFWNEQAEQNDLALEVGKLYSVTGGVIKYENKQYPITKHDCNIQFDSNTRFQLIEDESLKNIGRISYKFTKFKDVGSLAANTSIDVIGIVDSLDPIANIKSKKDGSDLTKRNVHLVDDSKTIIELELWGDDIKLIQEGTHPVVVIKNAKVNEYNGNKKLKVQGDYIIALDPEYVDEAKELRKWYSERAQDESYSQLTATSADDNYKTRSISLRQINDEGLGKHEKADFFMCIGGVFNVNTSKDLIYFSCSSCKKKVQVQPDGSFYCEKCKFVVDAPVAKYNFSFRFYDHSGSTYITAIGDDASIQSIIGMSAPEFAENIKTKDENAIKQMISTKVDHCQFRIKAKVHEEEFNNKQYLKINLVSASKLNYAEAANNLAKEIESRF